MARFPASRTFSALDRTARLVAPVAPHVAEELWDVVPETYRSLREVERDIKKVEDMERFRLRD